MNLTYDYGKLDIIVNIGSDKMKDYSLEDISNDSTVQSIAATTNKNTTTLLLTTFKEFPVRSSMSCIIATIKDHIIVNGYPTCEGLLKYTHLLNWCEENNIRDVAGALEDVFGTVTNVHLSDVIPTCKRLREDYL